MEVAKVLGADERSPYRYRDRANPAHVPIGDPPAKFDQDSAALWQEFTSDMPWLSRSDRCLLGLAVRLKQRMELPDAPISLIAQMRLVLASLGATPVDRSKVTSSRQGDEVDPLSEFAELNLVDVSTGAIGPKQTLVNVAANGSFEPIVEKLRNSDLAIFRRKPIIPRSQMRSSVRRREPAQEW